jgi:hypothetical protein
MSQVPVPIRQWVAAYIDRVCRMSLDESGRDSGSFADWSTGDLECALLALRMKYCIFRASFGGAHSDDVELQIDFDGIGAKVWTPFDPSCFAGRST